MIGYGCEVGTMVETRRVVVVVGALAGAIVAAGCAVCLLGLRRRF